MKHLIPTLFVLAFFAAAIYGYIANIASLVSHVEPIGMSIGRAIGIFVAPLGVILGYV